MTSSAQSKGARNEWKATRYLIATCPDLLVHNPRPKLGAGRKDDEGDLIAFDLVSVQVKAYKNHVTGCRKAAAGAERQRANLRAPLGLGMVPVHNARQTTVNWLCVSEQWPTSIPTELVLVTGMTSLAVDHVRNEKGDLPRTDRVAVIRRSNDPDMWMGTVEAWVAAYRAWLAANLISAAA